MKTTARKEFSALKHAKPFSSRLLWSVATIHSSPELSRAAENQCWPRKLPPQPAFCHSPFPCANLSRTGDLLTPRVCVWNNRRKRGSCDTQRVKHSSNHISALLRAGALAQPTSGHPGVPQRCCDILPGGDSLWSPGIATGHGKPGWLVWQGSPLQRWPPCLGKPGQPGGPLLVSLCHS